MPEAQTYQDIWIRWIHSTWEKDDDWRPDIRPSVLSDSTITKALFILDDYSCAFIPMEELRKALAGKAPNKNGSIIFNVNPRSRTVDGKLVTMDFFQSKKNKALATTKLLEDF